MDATTTIPSHRPTAYTIAASIAVAACSGEQRAVLACGPAVRTATPANPSGLAAGTLSLAFTATQRDGALR